MPKVLVAVVITLLGCVISIDRALPQDSNTTDTGQTSGSGSGEDTAKCKKPGGGGGIDTITMTGSISYDSRVFTSDNDQKSWSITNTDSVKGHEGKKVTVKGWVDADKNEMCVESVRTAGEKAPEKNEKNEKK